VLSDGVEELEWEAESSSVAEGESDADTEGIAVSVTDRVPGERLPVRVTSVDSVSVIVWLTWSESDKVGVGVGGGVIVEVVLADDELDSEVVVEGVSDRLAEGCSNDTLRDRDSLLSDEKDKDNEPVNVGVSDLVWETSWERVIDSDIVGDAVVVNDAVNVSVGDVDWDGSSVGEFVSDRSSDDDAVVVDDAERLGDAVTELVSLSSDEGLILGDSEGVTESVGDVSRVGDWESVGSAERESDTDRSCVGEREALSDNESVDVPLSVGVRDWDAEDVLDLLCDLDSEGSALAVCVTVPDGWSGVFVKESLIVSERVGSELQDGVRENVVVRDRENEPRDLDTDRDADCESSSEEVAEFVPEVDGVNVVESVAESSSEWVVDSDGLSDMVTLGDRDAVGLLEMVTVLLWAAVSDAETLNLRTIELDHELLVVVLLESDVDEEMSDNDVSGDKLLESLSVMDSLSWSENDDDFDLLRSDRESVGSNDGEVVRENVRLGVSDMDRCWLDDSERLLEEVGVTVSVNDRDFISCVVESDVLGDFVTDSEWETSDVLECVRENDSVIDKLGDSVNVSVGESERVARDTCCEPVTLLVSSGENVFVADFEARLPDTEGSSDELRVSVPEAVGDSVVVSDDENVGSNVGVAEGSFEADFQEPVREMVTESVSECSRETEMVGVGLFESDGDGTCVGVDVSVLDAVAVAERDKETSSVSDPLDRVKEVVVDDVVENDIDGTGDAVPDADSDLVEDSSGVLDSVEEDVMVSEADTDEDDDRDSSNVSDRLVGDADSVTDEEADAVTDSLWLNDAVAVSSERLSSSVCDGDSVRVAVAVSDCDVVSDGLREGSGEAESVGDDESVRLCDSDCSLVGVADRVSVGPSKDCDTVSLTDHEDVTDCDAVSERSEVVDGVTENDSLTTEDSETVGEAVNDGVADGVGVGGGVIVDVCELESLFVMVVVSLGVLVSVSDSVDEGSSVREWVGEPDIVNERDAEPPSFDNVRLVEVVSVELELMVRESETLPSSVKLSPVMLALREAVWEADDDRVIDADRELVVVTVAVDERVGLRRVTVSLSSCETEEDTEYELERDTSSLWEAVGVNVSVGVLVLDAVKEAVCVADSVAVRDLETLGSDERDANVEEGDTVKDADVDDDIVTVDETEALLLATDADASVDNVGDLVKEMESVGDTVAVGDADSVGSGVSVSVGDSETVSCGVVESDMETSCDCVLDGLKVLTEEEGSEVTDDESDSVRDCVLERVDENREAVLLIPRRCWVTVISGMVNVGAVGDLLGAVRDTVAVADDDSDNEKDDDGIPNESDALSEWELLSDRESTDCDSSSESEIV
jgi:hypothetical protein